MAKSKSATPEQKTASNPAASAWVGANAGSGKTHVLVDRVTRLMLAGVDPMSILCLTYTKAAAKEMANRLHERLGAWVGLSNAELPSSSSRWDMMMSAIRYLPGRGGCSRRRWKRRAASRFKRSMPSAKEFCSSFRSRPGLLRDLKFWSPTKPNKSCGAPVIMYCVRRK